jgi:hypothetical protein
MTAQAQTPKTVTAARSRRRDVGKVRLTQRDIDGLLLCGEHYGAPSDLLAEALGVTRINLYSITQQWRRAGYLVSAQIGPGPTWHWLTLNGMTATGLGFPAIPPAVGRLAHTRAILAARLWLTAGPAWAGGQAWWHSERRLLAEHPRHRGGHVPDAEIHWPCIDGSPYADQIWAVEVELTAKQIERTTKVMTGLLSLTRYATVVYLTAPVARSMVLRAVALLPTADQSRVAIPGPARQRVQPGVAAMSVWSWLRLAAYLWLLRKAAWVAKWVLLGLLALAAWPVTLVTVAGCTAAWLRGWPAVRLRWAVVFFLPFTAWWLGLAWVRQGSWRASRTLVRDWARGSWPLTHPDPTWAFLQMSLVAIPAGLGLAALAWSWRNYAMSSGIGGWLASAPITFDARQWKRQVGRAGEVNKAPGAVPLLARVTLIPVGGTIRTIGHRWRSVFNVPSAACARHMVIVGATGSGKTNLMMRLQTGWFTATRRAAPGGRGPSRATQAGRGPRPLLIVLDCNGPDARVKADRTRRLLYEAGAERVAIWPDEARLSVWDLPPDDLAAAVPDDRQRHRGGRLLRRHPAGRPHPVHHRTGRTTAERGRVPGPAGRRHAAQVPPEGL